ncbi:MAG TPA: universal stress protein [Planctomycetaceae bacterium]|nr:universal stress protein [Planctomycetaceae bacterium]HRF01471.1 universal stress protein [Pirellulaceae bacterium]
MGFINRILVPTDFSPNADKALQFALKLASDCRASVHLLYVDDDPMLNAPTTSDEFRDKFEDRMATTLAAQLTDEQRNAFRCEYAVARGDAAVEIINYAAAQSIDLIVMGVKGRSAFADILLGSVANKVVHKSTCPVVSVRG